MGRWRREGTALRGAGSNPRVCVFCSHLLPDGLSLSFFLGLVGFGSPLQAKTTITKRDGIRIGDRDGKDTFACPELRCGPDCSKSVRRIWSACTRLGTGRLSDPYPQGTRHCCTSRMGLVPRSRTVSIWSSRSGG